MANKNFFKVAANIKRPTQNKIELIRRGALRSIQKGRKSDGLDAKSIEAMLRMVSGRYGNLHSDLESDYRSVDHKLDSKRAQGIKEAKSLMIKIERDIHQLETMGYDKAESGIDYEELLSRLRKVTKEQYGPTGDGRQKRGGDK